MPAEQQHQSITTIRLSPRDQKMLIDDLESRAGMNEFTKERRSVRVTFNIGQVKVSISNPGSDPITFLCVPRNLSSGGMAFIHGQFVHLGATITVTLPRLYDVPMEITGKVVRCRHVKGLLHEVGVVFDEEIEIHHFVKLSTDQMKQVAEDTGAAVTGHVVIAMFDENKQPVKYSVMPRKINDHTLEFQHGRFFEPDTACVVGLTLQDGMVHRVVSRITDCRCVEEGINRITVAFNEELDLKELYGEDHQPVDDTNEAKQTIRALIVDDSEADRQLISFRLGQKGYEVSEAYGGVEAVEAIKQGNIDVILLDIFLDGECGLDVAKTMREMGYKGPIVALSADEHARTPADALEAGCNAFLLKPIELDELQKAVDQLLTFDIQWEELESVSQPFGPIRSDLVSDKPSQKLLEFVDSVGDRVDELQVAFEMEDKRQLKQICELLKSDGKSYGYRPITNVAMRAADDLNSDKQLDQVKQSIDELVAVLLRIVP